MSESLELNTQEHRLLALLESRRHKPTGKSEANALLLARALKIRPNGSDDSKKKGVRNLVRNARAKQVPIVSDLRGYWIARVPGDRTAYHDMLRRMGLTHLASRSRSKNSPATKEAVGQRALF